jgi:hypothetical protein
VKCARPRGPAHEVRVSSSIHSRLTCAFHAAPVHSGFHPPRRSPTVRSLTSRRNLFLITAASPRYARAALGQARELPALLACMLAPESVELVPAPSRDRLWRSRQRTSVTRKMPAETRPTSARVGAWLPSSSISSVEKTGRSSRALSSGACCRRAFLGRGSAEERGQHRHRAHSGLRLWMHCRPGPGGTPMRLSTRYGTHLHRSS